MYVPTARPDSIEGILYEESDEDKLLIFHPANHNEWSGKMLPHCSICLIYNPAYEKQPTEKVFA